MADYKELLRKAVEALPENNGAARRAVYEKARAALVGQLRAISPPLPARDITTHRLQLEDCIRQVEQEASEANIAGLGQDTQPPAPSLPPVFAAENKARPAPSKPPAEPARAPARSEPAKARADSPKASPRVDAKAPAQPRAEAKAKSELAKGKPAINGSGNSIEDIIVSSERERSKPPAQVDLPAPETKSRPPKSQPVLVAKSEPKGEAPRSPARKSDRPLPSIVARAEAAKGRSASNGAAFNVAGEPVRRTPTIEPRREGRSNALAARQVDPMDFDVPDDLEAMSAVREVDVEQQPADPQGTIDRAIAALDRELDRESRGDAPSVFADDDQDDEPARPAKKNGFFNGRSADVPAIKAERVSKPSRPAKEFATPRRRQAFPEGMPRARQERRGMGAVTIFFIIFAALLVGAGGAGFWAWQEGFINLDAMFGKGKTVSTSVAKAVAPSDAAGPGNTETAVAAAPSTELKADARLAPVEAAPAPADTVAPLALQSPAADSKTEERLGADTRNDASAAAASVAAIDPASVAGSQSLLLEASDNGTTGAVPFSGTVDWSKGVDETGRPTLIGKANIPARNLSVEMLIRKNTDPSLPASHLMEINFTVSDSFIGGSIAGLPGVLLKNEELVQGAPLVGASARVVGNSFLFALSASPEDSTANVNLLTTRKWMDLALIYASGKRAIITLEKDDKAQKLFADVFKTWAKG